MPKTLLLADDSVTIQKVVGISFANEDVVLLTVDNGDDAVARAQETNPDVILADVAMPGKDGYEVCEAIKGDPALRHIPVLLLSGTFESFDEDRARQVGADGHITKPFEAQALVDRVNELLARGESQRPVAVGTDTTVLVSEPPSAPDAFDFFEDELAQTSPSPGLAMASRAPSDEAPVALEEDEEEPIELSTVEDEESEGEPLRAASLDDVGDEPGEIGSSSAATLLFDADIPSFDAESAAETSVATVDFDADDEPAVAYAGRTTPSPAAAPFRVAEPPMPPPVPTRSEPARGFDFDGSDVEADDEPLHGAPMPPPIPDGAPSQADDAHGEPSDDGLEADVAHESDAHSALFEAELEQAMAMAPPPGPPEARVASGPAGADAPRSTAPPAPPSSVAASVPDDVLRKELREQLEKVAWDAFGDLSERIVRETVARVESIAWEVIPQMAEALIREEIRRLREDGEDPGGR
jgi:CheY-like chemotaxis protein